ncbi:MAG: ABC transporter ATP-binding protein [Tepidisphaerales bacterium]
MTATDATSERPPHQRASLGRLWSLTRGFRLRYLLAVVALGGAVALGYLPAAVVAAAVDLVLTPAAQSASDTGVAGWAVRVLEALGVERGRPATLWVPAALVVAFAAASAALMYVKGRLVAQATERLVRRLREQLYDRLQHLPLSWHDRHATGDLVQRCTSDVETLRAFYSTQTVEIARALLLLAVSVPLMWAVDGPMLLASVALLPPIVGFSVFFFRRVRSRFLAMDEAEGAMSATLQENLTGIRVVRAFARQDHEIDRFDRRNAAHRDNHWGLFKVMSQFWATSDFMCFAQLLLVLGYGVYSVTGGRITLGELLFFLTIVQMYLWPVREMGRTLTETGKALVAVGRVDEILAAAPEADPELAAVPSALPARLDGRIELEDVWFSHRSRPVLRGISLTVEPGETLALLGPSGAGKTTLVSLLLRFYDPDRGVIRLGGFDLSRLPRGYVRSQFGVVLQEPFLFSKSVSENIRLGRPDAAREQILQVAHDAAVHASIQTFHNGYDTVVGERGVTLSGGQRQRVALARALLRDAPFLVLDDALSAVDTHTEAAILEALRRRAGRCTTVLIAHRLSTVMHADRIAVLEAGRITQLGTHAELVNQDGLYRRLWQIQTDLEDDLREELAGAAVASAATPAAPLAAP